MLLRAAPLVLVVKITLVHSFVRPGLSGGCAHDIQIDRPMYKFRLHAINGLVFVMDYGWGTTSGAR
jgi:hypothetical protein